MLFANEFSDRQTSLILPDILDIYMPDFKFWSGRWADRYCGAPDYPEVAAKAVREMHGQVGDLSVSPTGIAEGGLLLRHLVMPCRTAGTEQIMKFLAEEISPNTYVNVMDRYRPCGGAGSDEFIGRRLSAGEFRESLEWARSAGLQRLDSRTRQRIFISKQ